MDDFPPHLPSVSTMAETVITSGKLAGTVPPASLFSFPASHVVCGLPRFLMAEWRASSGPSPPQLKFATSITPALAVM